MTFRVQFIVFCIILSYSVAFTHYPSLPITLASTIRPRYHALALFIAATQLYMADFFNNRFRPVFWPVILALISSFFLKSISGVTMTFLLFSVIVLVNLRYLHFFYVGSIRSSFKRYKLIFIIVVVLVGIALFLLGPYLYQGLRLYKSKIHHSGRVAIIDLFFAELTPIHALTGFVPSFLATKGLPNTYLWMIAAFGALSLIPFGAMLIALRNFFEQSTLFLGLLLLLGIYFAGEMLFPFHAGDTLFIPLLVISLHADYIRIPGRELL